MTCPKCDQSFEDRCTCGYQPKGLAVQAQWLIQYCSRPGCATAIRVKAGQQELEPVCKWCRDDTLTPKLGIVVDSTPHTARAGFTALAKLLPPSLRTHTGEPS